MNNTICQSIMSVNEPTVLFAVVVIKLGFPFVFLLAVLHCRFLFFKTKQEVRERKSLSQGALISNLS